jgi:glutamate--cysteine ligase
MIWGAFRRRAGGSRAGLARLVLLLAGLSAIPGAALGRGFDYLVRSLRPEHVQRGLRGVEVEGQRVNALGTLSREPHPRALGSALKHPRITTDYAESQSELITSPVVTNAALVTELDLLHAFVQRKLPPGELLWAASMPGPLHGRGSVPIAQYGNSLLGQLKTLYREGLLHRYGDAMQAISGVHFNYSFPGTFWPALAKLRDAPAADQRFISDQYFGLLRNYRRIGWLTTYLFGASPAVHASFLDGAEPRDLERGRDGTLVGRYATSLRQSGDLGYAIKGGGCVQVSDDGLDRYLVDLASALHTPNPAFRGIYRQLTDAPLQLPAELYGVVRPKRTPRPGEHPTQALRRAGVEYVEVRNPDRNPFEPTGVEPASLHFLETLVVAAALHPSPVIVNNSAEQAEITHNHHLVAREGRRPGLKLRRKNRDVELRTWAEEILRELDPVCALLDAGLVGQPYRAALAEQRAKVEDPARTPSARVAALLEEQSFVELTLEQSRAHQKTLLAAEVNPAELARLEQEAASSLQAQHQQEAADRASGVSFERYLERYLAQTEPASAPSRSSIRTAPPRRPGGREAVASSPR